MEGFKVITEKIEGKKKLIAGHDAVPGLNFQEL